MPPVARLMLACASLGALAACSRVNALLHPGASAPAPPAASASHSASASSASADMVSAVVLGKTDVPVSVQFDLRQRPEVGQPAELDLLITPSAPLERVMTSFHAGEGLTLRGGSAPAVEDRPEPGVPIRHTLTIVAQQDGIFYVDATVLADLGTGTLAHTFTIPVIAGAGAQ